MKYYEGMIKGVLGVGAASQGVRGIKSAASAIGKRARRKKTSDADKKTFTDLEQGADIKRKAAEVRKKKDPKNQSLRPRARPKNATSLRPKVRPR